MHEANINTKTSVVGEKDGIEPSQYVGGVDTPYGIQLVKRGEALNHASMRSSQLSGLLQLIGGVDDPHFARLQPAQQDNLLWLARQLANEADEMLDIIAADMAGGRQ
ncbi:hypothetical protein E7V67_006270 [[Empedobacter] haloabium]|uniref:DUF3077 domain-containing protein n=1 Tax=[Empedobacter] haloabium TaxID=592317 RepID=A0ABZ1UPW7_9BURK